MRIQKVLIAMLLLLAGGMAMHAQNARVSISDSSLSLGELINQIEKQTDYLFVMGGDIDKSIVLPVSVRNASVETVLNSALPGAGLDFRFSNNYITLIRQTVHQGPVQSAQVGFISGTVVDESGLPVIGAAVIQQGSATNGTVTDENGLFQIRVPAGTGLEVSCIGYTTRTATATPGMNIVLDEDSELLAGTVVIAYGTVKRTNLTGSVATYNVADSPLSNVPHTNAAEMLRGLATGVSISQSGVAGDRPSIQIRGQKSVSGSSDPLIVLDGVIYKGSIDDIDPTSIESMSVMKDATSLASYGSQAANGVIMITSKKGSRGKASINFRSSVSLVQQNYKPEIRNGEQYLELINARLGNSSNDISWLSPLEIANYNKGISYDWTDFTTRLGVQQNYAINLSGATEDVNYIVGAGYENNKNYIKNNDYIRRTVMSRVSTNVGRYITAGLNFNWAGTTNDGLRPSTSSLGSPYAEPYMPDGSLRHYMTGEYRDNFANPMWNTSDEVDNERRGNAATMGASLEVKIPWIKGLSYKITGNYTLRQSVNRTFYHEGYYNSYADETGDSHSAAANDAYLNKANGSITNTKYTGWVLDNILTYNREFGKHYINATLVYTRDSDEVDGQTSTGTDFSLIGNTNLGFYGLNNAVTQKISEISYTLHTDVGYLARLNYSYADKYHFNASFRRDGSSVFGAKHKWGNFPAIGAAWTISDEDFFRNNVRFVDYLKLKLSWGKNGNQSLAPYNTLSKLIMGRSGGTVVYFDDQPVYGEKLTTLGNQDLGWETTESWNGGWEADLFDRRVHWELDAYKSKTFDQIFNRTIPVMGSGITTQQATMGRVDNWGIESSIRVNILRSSDWKWDASLNFTLNRNKLVDLYGDGKDDIANSLFIGKSLGAIYGYVWDGIVQSTDTAYMEANGVTPGDIKNKDIAGNDDGTPDGKITAADRQILGYDKEAFRASLSTTLSWKNWSLYLMFNGIFSGGEYGYAQNNNAYLSYTGTAQYNSHLNHPFWTESNPSNTYARPWNLAGTLNAVNHYGFVRLQDANLSYSLPSRLLKNVNIAGLTLYLSGTNLFFIAPDWKYSDPEVRNPFSQQLRRTYTFGLNVRF